MREFDIDMMGGPLIHIPSCHVGLRQEVCFQEGGGLGALVVGGIWCVWWAAYGHVAQWRVAYHCRAALSATILLTAVPATLACCHHPNSSNLGG